MSQFFPLGVVVIVGVTTIMGLVVIVRRTLARVWRARSRPASPEDDAQRRRLIRTIAATDYHARTRSAKDRPDRQVR